MCRNHTATRYPFQAALCHTHLQSSPDFFKLKEWPETRRERISITCSPNSKNNTAVFLFLKSRFYPDSKNHHVHSLFNSQVLAAIPIATQSQCLTALLSIWSFLFCKISNPFRSRRVIIKPFQLYYAWHPKSLEQTGEAKSQGIPESSLPILKR